MKKQILLSIPTPCHENWNEMTPVEKGRFCGSCQKQVVDFSRMSDREIAVFFKKPSKGSVCGRFMSDQLDRAIEIPKKRIPWLKYFFKIALPAFLFSCRGASQGKVKVKDVQTSKTESISICRPTMGIMSLPIIIRPTDTNSHRQTIKEKPIRLIGDTIIDLKPIPNEVTSSIKGEIDTMIVRNETKEALPKELEIPVGILSDTIMLPEVVINSTISHRMGMMIGSIITVRKGGKAIPSIIENEIILPKGFRIYPNPVQSGSIINLELKNPGKGLFMIQILSSSGQLIQENELSVDGETKTFTQQLPSITPGNYFLRLSNKQSGKSYTGKLLVE